MPRSNRESWLAQVRLLSTAGHVDATYARCMTAPIRIGNISGMFGDRAGAAREMLEGGPVDVLSGDWLAELTMLILAKVRAKHPGGGFGRTFVNQMEDVMGTVLERGVKVVTNAGGLDPLACAAAVQGVARRLGLEPQIAAITGDDLMGRISELSDGGEGFRHLDTGELLGSRAGRLVTANAYLGGWGIAAALDAGADIVITGRVTDAALAVGPAAWHHGWARTDWDRLAGAVAAGHVIECGCQATGGNYSFFTELSDPVNLPFPWAEIAEDGSSVIGKHDNTGGEVSLGTVVSQLLYEIGGPRYLNPDVTTRFDTVEVTEIAQDRVRLSGTKGEPPPVGLKVSAAYGAGYRNSAMIGLTGLDIEAKADLVETQFWAACPWEPADYQQTMTTLIGATGTGSNAAAISYLQIAVKDPDEKKVGRAWSNSFAQIALASVPGYHGVGPPGPAIPYADMWPTTVKRSAVTQTVVIGDTEFDVAETDPGDWVATPVQSGQTEPSVPGDVVAGPLGLLVGARSGDKGGNANLGVFVRHSDEFRWLAGFFTVETLCRLLPDLAGLRIDRYEFPNLLAVNFEIFGLLDQGVASALRPDPQGKGLGEYLRSVVTDLPAEFL